MERAKATGDKIVSQSNTMAAHDQKPTALLRTPDGQLAYPGYVPPAINAPEEPMMPRASWEVEERQRKNSDPFPAAEAPATDPPRRPWPSKRWQTAELPKLNASATAPEPWARKRAGTVSYPIGSSWRGSMAGYESSSSSDDLDVGPLTGEPEDGGEAITKVTTRGTTKDRQPSKVEVKDQRFRGFSVSDESYQTTGKVRKDGRLRITVHETAHTGYIAKALGAAAHRIMPKRYGTGQTTKPPSPSAAAPTRDVECPPRLNIVIMVIGSRGDAQPFLKIGKVLKERYGHRIRIATHPAFRDFVEKDSGLEFFSVGGDPSELMAFMVKNPGMIPTLETVRAGEIGRRRDAMAEMFEGFWRACVNATDDEKDRQNLKMMSSKDPFIADAIIANPPSFAHVHCAEALGIPLQLVFTFPYTPTQAFPHPLASIKRSNVDPGYTNFISYPLVEMMTWQGLGDLVNDFRVKTLNLDPVSTLWAPGATYRMHVPFTYLWSPGLVPKPEDWGEEIDVSGFVFLDLATAFHPPQELVEFLDAGEPPIYIGFGSIVVDDADSFTDMIFEAVEKAGVRALVSRGWGGFGRDDVPGNIFMLDNTPHDWLFPRVKGCVIHGGAGTTAIALKCGLPTMIVPFFGDQYFWGSMVGSSGAGPEPVPYKRLDSDKLAEGIQYLLTDKAKAAAEEIAESIAREGDGADNAVDSLQRHLSHYGPRTMRCSVLNDHVAVWRPKNCNHLRLSALAADIIVESGQMSWKKLRLLRHVEWNDFEGPGEPVTGVAGSLTQTLKGIFTGIGGAPYRLGRTAKKRIRKKMQRKRIKRQQDGKQTNGKAQDGKIPNGSVSKGKPNEARRPSTPGPGPGEYVTDVAKSVRQTALAIAKGPASLFLALSQGFHNAPRLYGDDTVRRPTRITGFRSGLVASRREFVYGLYDGVTGVVCLPVRGARRDGVGGFVKGTAMGLTGLVLKTTGAVVGPLGYTLQGLVKQVERRHISRKFVRCARITQGQRESRALSDAERTQLQKAIVGGWAVMRELRGAVVAEERRRGLAGQIDRVMLDTRPMFSDMDVARECLAEMRAGRSLEEVLGAHGGGTQFWVNHGPGHGRGHGQERHSNGETAAAGEKKGDVRDGEMAAEESAVTAAT
ncbi:Sterol 3-beta-glucosyltransferase UGT80B1 [Tolypocladium ophioglossoides CBS 100239]|uniref:Sterol 3-beta-glucosyltransferase UGT80B1 n=1 Tax=Tolypocladium ophioglossoides (strain CBS 100239) TaxID=1163406 RepID=A0A0L0NDI6_TOLOC|nr:Sterol 3-beta-glucosyltransferase UGT80B1 [Tolypocladium ophioglossoides CBS 100239]